MKTFFSHEKSILMDLKFKSLGLPHNNLIFCVIFPTTSCVYPYMFNYTYFPTDAIKEEINNIYMERSYLKKKVSHISKNFTWRQKQSHLIFSSNHRIYNWRFSVTNSDQNFSHPGQASIPLVTLEKIEAVMGKKLYLSSILIFLKVIQC